MHAYTCPTCGAEIVAERFTSDVIACPGCGAQCLSQHGCNYDTESGEEWCSDWLELVGEGE